MEYRALIVDDERTNIIIVKKLIKLNFPKINIVGEVSTTNELVQLANDLKPEILLLDINLGNNEVFEVLNLIDYNPQIIFISSTKSYALDAFRFNATDFLLKPVSQDILVSALTKAIRRLEMEVSKNFLQNSSFLPSKESSKFVTISSMDKYEILRLNEILFCKAEGRCTAFYLKDGRRIYSSKNLMEYNFLHEKNTFFIKISRSHIVNFEHVIKVIKKVGVYCELINGITIPVSRRRISEFNKFITSFE